MPSSLEKVLEKLRAAKLVTFNDVSIDGPNTKGNTWGDTPLHIVAIWGDTESARILIEAGAEIDACGEDDYTPLHNAIEQGNADMVALLLKAGANPFRTSRNGDAFVLAQLSEDPEILGRLRH